MILAPISYNPSEISLIAQKLGSTAFTKDSWSDDDLAPLKDKIKQHYISQQGNKCPYCQTIIRSIHGRIWDTEHIIPRSSVAKFMFEPKNLCACCIDCNTAKGDKKITNSRASKRLPSRSKDYLIIHPHFDNYHDYIMVIKPGFYYVALTEKGKATIEICELNRFYQFAQFDDALSGDDRIFLLSEELGRVSEEIRKIAIRKEIAFLAIYGNMKSS